MQWRGYLLQFGTHSAHLHDSVASLAGHLANNVVEWDEIRALMASRLIVRASAQLELGRLCIEFWQDCCHDYLL